MSASAPLRSRFARVQLRDVACPGCEAPVAPARLVEGGAREVVLPVDTIEEVVRWRPALDGEAEALAVRGDEDLLHVGLGLEPAELAWLHAELERHLDPPPEA